MYDIPLQETKIASIASSTLSRFVDAMSGVTSEFLRAQTGLQKLPNVLGALKSLFPAKEKEDKVVPIEKAPEVYHLLEEVKGSVSNQVTQVLEAMKGVEGGEIYRTLLQKLDVYFKMLEKGTLFTKSQLRDMVQTLKDIEDTQDKLAEHSIEGADELVSVLSTQVGRKLDQLVEIDETLKDKMNIPDPREYLSGLVSKIEGSPLFEEGLDVIGRGLTGPLWDIAKQLTGVHSGVQLLTKMTSAIYTPFISLFGYLRRVYRRQIHHLSRMDRSLHGIRVAEAKDKKSYFLYRIWDAVKKFMMFKWLGSLTGSLSDSLGSFFGVGAGAVGGSLIGKLSGITTLLARFVGIPYLIYDLVKNIRKHGLAGVTSFILGGEKQPILSRTLGQAGKGAIVGAAFGPVGALIGAGVGAALGALGPYIRKGFKGLWGVISEGWKWFTERISRIVSGGFQLVKDIGSKIGELFGLITQLPEKIGSAVLEGIKSLYHLPGKVGSSIIHGIKLLWPFHHTKPTTAAEAKKADISDFGLLSPAITSTPTKPEVVYQQVQAKHLRDRVQIIEKRTESKVIEKPVEKPESEPVIAPVPISEGTIEAPGTDPERVPLLIDDLGIILAGSGLL